MSKKPAREEILASIGRLPVRFQRKVLAYASSLHPQGTRGMDSLRFQGLISSVDIESITAAIEEGCERIDENGE